MESDFYDEYREIEDRHWWFLGRRRILLSTLDELVAGMGGAAGQPRQLLDVGCGTGTMLNCLSRYGEVRGVDADADAVRHCRARGLERVSQVDDDARLPFEAASFDLVTVLDVLEHVDDDHAMLTDLLRVLRPGGALVVTVPAYRLLWGAQDEISHHKRRYRAKQLADRLARAGFEVQRTSYFNTLLFPAIAAVRLARRLDRRPRPLRSDFQLTRPGRANDLLARLFRLEARLLKRVDLPFGVSIIAVAKSLVPESDGPEPSFEPFLERTGGAAGS